MRKVSKVSDLNGMELEVNVISVIEEQLNILDESYGIERNIDSDLGGYVLILETKDDVIEVKEKSKKLTAIQEALNEVSKSGTMPWVTVDVDAVKGTFTAIPRREEIVDLADIKEQLVVEFYSK